MKVGRVVDNRMIKTLQTPRNTPQIPREYANTVTRARAKVKRILSTYSGREAIDIAIYAYMCVDILRIYVEIASINFFIVYSRNI